jgi:hypothetical protein
VTVQHGHGPDEDRHTDAPGLPEPADSPGTPWHGRPLSSSGFEHDHGEADPDLRASLHAVTAHPSVATERELMRHATVARWLVPVVPTPVDTVVVDGQRVEGHAEMSAVTLTAPDGQRALLLFTGVDSLAAWDPQARPVPVDSRRAGEAAVSDGCDVIVVDLGSSHAYALRPSMVWALTMGYDWLPAHEDPFVARAVARAVADEPAVAWHALSEGVPPGRGILRLTVRVVDGLDEAQIQALATRVGARLATDGETRVRLDGLSFQVERQS